MATQPAAVATFHVEEEISAQATQRAELKRSLLRSVPFLVRWINSLQLDFTGVPLPMKAGDGEARLTPSNLFDALSNGLLLCQIHEVVGASGALTMKGRAANTSVTLRGVNKRPMTKAVILKNIEIALRFAWQRSVRSSHMCTALDFYLGEVPKVLPCMLELLDLWKLRQVRARAQRVLQDLNFVLLPYGRNFLPDGVANYEGVRSSQAVAEA